MGKSKVWLLIARGVSVFCAIAAGARSSSNGCTNSMASTVSTW